MIPFEHFLQLPAQEVAALVRAGKPASEVLHQFDPVPQLLKNVRYDGGVLYFNEACQSYSKEAQGKCSSIVA